MTGPRALTLLVLWAATRALIPGALAAQTTLAATPTTAPLAPGDAIRVTFWREPAMNGEYAVDDAGSVVLPLLGARRVIGVSPERLKEQLSSEYGQELTTRDDVQIVLLRRVRVLGAVKQPGLYRVDPTMTLGDAVALAGGATHDGKLEDIRILRDGREVRSSLEQGASVYEHVRSGDQILVPERSWLSRHGALVLGATITAAGTIVAALVIR